MQVIQTLVEDPWVDSEDKVECHWTYPESDLCRLATFRDLWKSGYFLTDGSKFGGDFLVYCGDPVKYHAKYIVICIKNSHVLEEARTQDLVARCRLGAGVKKIVLFSWLEGDRIKYKSLTRWEECDDEL